MAQSANPSAAAAEVRLGRLWKGTLLVGVASAYALLIALMFVHYGWRPALLALVLIVVSQFLRYIAGDVDRIGWNLARQHDKSGDEQGADSNAIRHQRRLFRLLVALAQVVNLALVAQALFVGGALRAAATLIGLMVVEVLFAQIRSVNRRVDFERASYGVQDSVLIDRPQHDGPWDEARTEKLNQKLGRLRRMAEAGEISQKAYEKARDRWLVRVVMEENEGDRR